MLVEQLQIKESVSWASTVEMSKQVKLGRFCSLAFLWLWLWFMIQDRAKISHKFQSIGMIFDTWAISCQCRYVRFNAWTGDDDGLCPLLLVSLIYVLLGDELAKEYPFRLFKVCNISPNPRGSVLIAAFADLGALG